MTSSGVDRVAGGRNTSSGRVLGVFDANKVYFIETQWFSTIIKINKKIYEIVSYCRLYKYGSGIEETIKDMFDQ